MDWSVITLGRFSRNRYWGEDEGTAYRNAICTSTLIRADGCNILVDPSLPSPDMEAALDGCTGLKASQVDIVYITHAHGDHFTGLNVFPNAEWFCAPDELAGIRSQLTGTDATRMQPANDEFVPGVRLIRLPGHTLGLAGLIFDSCDGVIAVAGDAVMTRDFFNDRRGYFNSVDFERSAKSIELLAASADIIVPGHGNYFIIPRTPKP
jgi:glyoxylase-like metal-dependent hydrolase (beta-lactamase superfamily II)